TAWLASSQLASFGMQIAIDIVRPINEQMPTIDRTGIDS
ncbi:MAG: hypothetical protein J07HX5_00784, partial [halophilic archaeon J07HX5]